MNFIAEVRGIVSNIFASHGTHFPLVAEFNAAADRVAHCGNQMAIRVRRQDRFADLIIGMRGRSGQTSKRPSRKRKAER